jgi:hypothetical protein
MSNLFTNVWGQFHSWFQAVGIFILIAVITYLYNTASNEWSWSGIISAFLGALLTYGFTKNDHAKTGQAVQKAVEQTVITTQEVLEKEKGVQG